MISQPPRWTEAELAEDATISADNFRSSRLAPSDLWANHYNSAYEKFEVLLEKLNDLNPGQITDAKLADVYTSKLGEALRYLAGPPISEDDLQVLSDVESLAPGVLSKDIVSLRKVYDIIARVVDPFRFPWIVAGTEPTENQKNAAILASAVLLAAQRIATERRNTGKEDQELTVKNYLRSQGFSEVKTETINTIVKGPGPMQFCGEAQLGERKADIIVRLHDTRLMAIECKVSNSATNSVKRLNNDAAVKAEYWLKTFGTSQVVPAAMLSGVFKLLNLVQAQDRGLTMFWAHHLVKLGDFIESTR